MGIDKHIKLKYLIRKGATKRDLCLQLKVSLDRLNCLIDNTITVVGKGVESRINKLVSEAAVEAELSREQELHDES